MGSRWLYQSGWSHFLNTVLSKPQWCLAGIGLLTAFFLWQLPGLSFHTSISGLIIQDIPENHQYQQHKSIFGSDRMIRVVIRAEDVYDPITFQKIRHFSEAAAKIKGVQRVVGLTGIKQDMNPTGGWSLDHFAEVMESVPLFIKNVVSKEGSTTIVNLILKSEADADKVIEEVEQLIKKAPEPLSLYQIGIPLISQALTQYAKKDFLRLPPLTLAAIALILILLYRNAVCFSLPLATVLLTMIWTFGLMAIMDIPISLVTMIVPVFLIAVGTAYCLHVCSTYMSHAFSGDAAPAVVRTTLDHVALPSVLAVLTTIVGIGSLWFNRIPAIRQFALMTCFGMFSLMILLVCFIPAVMCLVPLPKSGLQKPRVVEQTVKRILNWIVYINTVHRKKALALFLILAGLFGAGIPRIRVETNPMEFFKENTPVSRHFHDIYRDMSGSFPVHVVLRGNAEYFFESPKHVVAIKKLQQFLDTLPGVDKSVSFADYLQLISYITNKFDADFYRLPEEGFELRMLINTYKSLLGKNMLTPFMNPDFSAANILLLTHLSSSQDFRELRDAILRYGRESLPPEMSVNVTGLGVVVSASSHLLTLGQIKSLSLCLGIVFLIMMVLFLSSKVGVIAVFPNCFPIIVNFGLMGWLGIKLSIATSLIAGIVIGLAVDDTIHYLVRYNREFRKDLNRDRALRASIMGVGKPIIFTTLTISVGFSFLMLSHFQPTAVFGGLMVVTMLSALMADLILLPGMMLRVELITAWDLMKTIPTMGRIPMDMVHELNQPLNAIKMGSEFLRIMVRKGQEVKKNQLEEVAGEISTQVDRASSLVRRMSESDRSGVMGPGAVNVNGPVRTCISMIENQLKLDDIKFRLDLSEHLPLVAADPERLTQIIYNLMSNAREAIQRNKKDPSAARTITVRTVPESGEVKIIIADSGTGIPEHVKDRIFEPFYTTKAAGKGLGLPISREIIRDFHGRIEVHTASQQGAMFMVSLPALYPEEANLGRSAGNQPIEEN